MPLPAFIELESFPGADTASKLTAYLNELHSIYLQSIVHGNLTFRGLRVGCRRAPATHGKEFAFWHLTQEGRIEDERQIDLERCRRLRWISWIIGHPATDGSIRVFTQLRDGKPSWVLWSHAENYAVVLHPRRDYFLLKTAFLVKPHKTREFLQDWTKFQTAQTAAARGQNG